MPIINHLETLRCIFIRPTSKFYVEAYGIDGKPIQFNRMPSFRGQSLELIIYAKCLSRTHAYGLWKEVSFAGKVEGIEVSFIEFINAKTREVEKKLVGVSTKKNKLLLG